MRDRRARPSQLLPFLGIALLVHLAMLPWMRYLLPEVDPATELREVRAISLSERDWEHNRQIRPRVKAREQERPKTKEELEEDKQERENLAGQVVDIPKPAEEEEPEETDLVSEYASRVDKQTRSKHATKDYENAAEKPTRTELEVALHDQRARAEERDRVSAGAEQEQKKQGDPSEERLLLIPHQQEQTALLLPEAIKDRGLVNRSAADRMAGNNRDKLQVSPELMETPNPDGRGGVHDNNLPRMAELMPDLATLERIRGDPANDYLPDIDEDEATRLNTRKSYLAAYINRIKRTVNQFWRPRDAFRAAQGAGVILSPRDYVTELHVVLNGDGSLHKLVMRDGCGVEYFDRAGMSAFEEAEAFPNPPPAIKDEDGLIRFNFAFALLLGSSSRPAFQLTLNPAVRSWQNMYKRGLMPPPR